MDFHYAFSSMITLHAMETNFSIALWPNPKVSIQFEHNWYIKQTYLVVIIFSLMPWIQTCNYLLTQTKCKVWNTIKAAL